MAKVKTNEQALKTLLKNIDDMDMVIIRTYLLEKADSVLNDEAGIREAYKNHILHPNLIIQNAQRIKENLGFEGR
jgi:hypothetical protein